LPYAGGKKSGGGRVSNRKNKKKEEKREAGCYALRAQSKMNNEELKMNCCTQCQFVFGQQPAEGTLVADLRDASCGPPPGGGCGPLRPYGRNSLFKIQDSKLATSRCLRHLFFSRQPRSRADGPAFELRENAALRPGAAAGCCALAGANS